MAQAPNSFMADVLARALSGAAGEHGVRHKVEGDQRQHAGWPSPCTGP